MAIVRAPRESNYSIISNEPIEDARLSWEALGLLTFLLSKPDWWEVSIEYLIKYRKEHAKAYKVRRAMAELEEHGYAVKMQKNENGKFEKVQWYIYDTPHDENHKAVQPDLLEQEQPLDENQQAAPFAENQKAEETEETCELAENQQAAPLRDLPLAENQTLVITDNNKTLSHASAREASDENTEPPEFQGRKRLCPHDFEPSSFTRMTCQKRGCQKITEDEIATFIARRRAQELYLSLSGWQYNFQEWMIRGKAFVSEGGQAKGKAKGFNVMALPNEKLDRLISKPGFEGPYGANYYDYKRWLADQFTPQQIQEALAA